MRFSALLHAFLCYSIPAAAATQSSGLSVAWQVASEQAAGTTVEVTSGEFVDSGWLQPPATLEIEGPLVSARKGKALLPANMRLARMHGAPSGAEYCTWNQGARPWAEKDVRPYFISARGPLVCVSPDSAGFVSSVKCLSADDFLLMNGYKIDFCKDPDIAGKVHTKLLAASDYPKDIKFGAVLNANEARLPCLTMAVRVRSHPELVPFSEPRCFGAVNSTVQFGEAQFSLLGTAGNHFSVRVDKPIRMTDLRLSVIRHFRVVPY